MLHASLHWNRVPPPQRQQEKQSPVASQRQQARWMAVPVLQHVVGQRVVTPSQVTRPCSRTEQSRSTAVQELLPEQLTVPVSQAAVAVQADSIPSER